MEDVTKVKKISFEFAIGEKWYDLKEAKTITLELPNIEVKLED